MDFVLYEGREEIAARAEKLMQDILDRYKTGVLISKVTMQNAQPPEQVQAAFDDAVKAKQDRSGRRTKGRPTTTTSCRRRAAPRRVSPKRRTATVSA